MLSDILNDTVSTSEKRVASSQGNLKMQIALFAQGKITKAQLVEAIEKLADNLDSLGIAKTVVKCRPHR